ncbi:hypothetical protein GIB67_008664 [Kingdonia uniflora]|uniref:AT-hook motif nuclear-localized protein n=1 Tax=Kingdonia uniflora TaxID=39325 RepID=A0A7J7M4Z3_9MAGN|nr:hypothetical protein GIB67_008664 [Kingdonia uniflora]
MTGLEPGQSSRCDYQLLGPEGYKDTHGEDQKPAISKSKATSSSGGRPPGSKNKPKQPIVVTQDSPNSFQSHILEVSPGEDVVKCTMDYARYRGRGVSVLYGRGTVMNVTLGEVGSPAGRVAALSGRFDIIQLTGTILPPPAPPGSGGLTIYLVGLQAQIIGGKVIGPLMTAGIVVLMAALFANAALERLPLGLREEKEKEEEETPLQLTAATSQTSGITRGGNGGSFYNLEMNNYQFPGNMFD